MDVLLAVVAIIVLVILFAHANLNVMTFLVYNSMTALVGLCLLAVDGVAYWTTAAAYGGAVVALLTGFVAGAALRIAPRPQTALRTAKKATLFRFPLPAMHATVWIVGLAACYHLVASGIPLFSSSVEVERFDFTSSGFFGVPGRMYLYGVPLVWMLSASVAQQQGIKWRKYGPWKAATVFFVTTAMLSGFKSGLLALTVTMIVSYVVISKQTLPLRDLVRRYWFLLLIPVVYGLALASTYTSYQGTDSSLFRQLLNRVTLVGAQPKQYAIEHRVAGPIENGILNDLGYFIQKYTGQSVAGEYSFERAVSARIINVNPASNAWTTPVTVGGIPELIFTLGAPLAMLAVFAVGVLLRVAHGGGSGVLGSFIRAGFVYATYSWLLKGGLVYYFLNIAVVAVMVLGILFVAGLFLPGRSERPVKTRGATIRMRPVEASTR
ncbi:hypothetical protein PlfCFBP13513_16155 [Plantibacter flavus]|uniref:hypothetical protein n=1 Tax=Plantibacter flavus TaxID=150123 RepID=UPI0010C1EFE9|nr:hypothetical protein [Plantibacter flavus]TKJ96932.1 hypothetical protein PlfCFBP13513_16155 [Plantibacter flavus]